MGIRLIRQSSTTPSVSNKDDARMIRYAYGYQDGILKNVGTQVASSVSGNTFKLGSGVIVLQGWELEIDANGWSMVVDNVATKRYYTVYLEVNLATEIAEIKSLYATTGIPTVDTGANLSAQTTGVARLLLYTFSSLSGVISDVACVANIIVPWTEAGYAKEQDLTSGAIVVKTAQTAAYATSAGSAATAKIAEATKYAESATDATYATVTKTIEGDGLYTCNIKDGQGSVEIGSGTFLYRLVLDGFYYFGAVVFGRNPVNWVADITRQALPLGNIYCSFEPSGMNTVNVYIRNLNGSTIATGYSGSVSFKKIGSNDFFGA